MKNVIVFLFVVFSQICLAQTGYIRQISDSNNIKVFGNVGFVDQDDNYLYIGANTTYDAGGFCTGANGQSFILKIDKLTGATVNSFNVNADTMVMQINDGFYHNNAIYFAGQSSRTPWTPTYSFISKYNLQTNQIEWTKSFQNESNWLYGINNIKFNKIDKKIYYCGNEISNTSWGGGFWCTTGFTLGNIDTLGNGLSGSKIGMQTFINNTAGTYTNSILFLNSSMELLNSSEKVIISLNEISGMYSITLPIQFYDQAITGWPVVSSSDRGDSYSPIGENTNLQFCKLVNSKLVRILNGNSGIYCYLSDTTAYLASNSKKISDFNLKYVTAATNRLFITCMDTSTNIHSNSLVNLEMDTALNIINSKKIIIDSITASSSVKTIFDPNTNSLYNIFTKQGYLDKSLFIHKTGFSSLNCNESSISINTLSFTSSSLTYTIYTNDSITKSNINLVQTPKGFTNDDACLTITGLINSQMPKNEMVLKSVSNNEFQIQSQSYLINQIVVYDLLGKKVISVDLKEYNATVNLQNYTNGLYFINIKCSNGQETTFKVIKGD